MNAIDSKQGASGHGPQTQGRTIHWADRYDMAVRLMTLGRDKSIRRRTAERAEIKPGDSVLDVGCGTGDLAIVASAYAGPTGKVYGIDAAPEMIDVARAKAASRGLPIDFKVDVIEALSFPDASVDVVLSSLMMHHLPDDLKPKGLREIRRVLKPGGRLLVADMARPTALHSHLAMVFLRHGGVQTGVQDLPAMMKAVGFSRIQSGKLGFFGMLGYVRGEVGE